MVAEQVYIFLWTLLTGVGMGVIFDFFRALRSSGRTRNLVVYIQDMIFWLIVGIMIITSSFLLNNGDLRGYMLIGYLLGAIVYMLLFSVYIKNFFILIFRAISGGLHWLLKPITTGLQKLAKHAKTNQIPKNTKENQNIG